MVRGKKIDKISLDNFVAPASIIIAHNSAFDRPICEKLSDIFSEKPWACSMSEIEWSRLGFEGTKLAYLANQFGFFYNGHRAFDDCNALLEILSRPIPKIKETVLNRLLFSARETRFRIWTRGPYGLKDLLKARGYRWNPGSNGPPKSWWIEVSEAQKDAETLFLRSHANLDEKDILVKKITAFDRYKSYHSGL